MQARRLRSSPLPTPPVFCQPRTTSCLLLNNLPGPIGLQQLAHQCRMDGVPASLRGDLSEYGHTQKRKIADDIQYLVAYKLVTEPQRGFVQHSFGCEYDSLSSDPPRAYLRAASRDLARKSKRRVMHLRPKNRSRKRVQACRLMNGCGSFHAFDLELVGRWIDIAIPFHGYFFETLKYRRGAPARQRLPC